MAEREWIQGQICFLERHEITSNLIARLESHWNGLRADRAMPRRDEVDPVELVRWLPYISIMELHYEPFRVRYRVVGTEGNRIWMWKQKKVPSPLAGEGCAGLANAVSLAGAG